jgi:hypothetical protein
MFTNLFDIFADAKKNSVFSCVVDTTAGCAVDWCVATARRRRL